MNDWRDDLATLGDVHAPRALGQPHPIVAALASDKRALAIAILVRAFTEAKGRLNVLADMLHCSLRTATTIVKDAGLGALGGQIRLTSGSPGRHGAGNYARRKLMSQKPRKKTQT